MAAKNGKWENGFPDLNRFFFNYFMEPTITKKITLKIRKFWFMVTILERYLICSISWKTVGHMGGGHITHNMCALFIDVLLKRPEV